jgi:WD40 repeat protein
LNKRQDFYQYVYPNLEAKCLACHSSVVKEGGLNLESAELIRTGGDSGEAVDPGDPEFSYLYMLASREDEPAMPPLPNKAQAKPLTPRELGILKQWIEEGAEGGVRQVDTSVAWQPIPESYKAVYSLAMTPNRQFVAAGRGNRIFLYDLVTRQETARLTDPSLQSLQHEGQPLYGPGVAHRDFVHALAMRPDGKMLASGGYRVIKLCERRAPANLGEISLAGPVRLSAFDAQGRWGAFVLESGEIKLWNLTTGEAGPVLPAGEQQPTAIALSADGNTLLVGEETGRIRLLNSADGEPQSELATPAAVTALAVRAQGPEILAAHGDNVIRAWSWPASGGREAPDENDENAPESEEEQEEKSDEAEPPKPVRGFSGHGQPVTQLVVLEEKNELLSGGPDQTVRLWNLESAEAVFNQNLGGVVTSVAVSEDGEWIVAGGEHQLARVWKRDGTAVGDLKGNMELARAEIARTDDVEVAKSQFQLAEQAHTEAGKDLEQRTESLTKANEAKEARDIDRLQRLLSAWSNSAELIPGNPDGIRARIAEISLERQQIRRELSQLRDSALGRLVRLSERDLKRHLRREESKLRRELALNRLRRRRVMRTLDERRQALSASTSEASS